MDAEAWHMFPWHSSRSGTSESLSYYMTVTSFHSTHMSTPAVRCLQDIIFSFPVKCKGGKWEIVQGLKIDDFSKAKLKATGAFPPVCCIIDKCETCLLHCAVMTQRPVLLRLLFTSLARGVLHCL